MARVLRTSLAEEDLLNIWTFIANDQHSPDTADRVLREIGELTEQLARFPMMGQSAERFRPNLRMFPKWSFVLFYEPIEDGILLFRVIRGARNFESVF